jgi:ElaB/YqjD/DUF883 family membrane-anchored ribosome-binding protein
MEANLNATVEDVEKAISSAVEAGEKRVNATLGRLQTQLAHLRAQFDELDDQARYQARKAARRTDEAVHSHPYRAIGIAAAAGLLVGWLASRR